VSEETGLKLINTISDLVYKNFHCHVEGPGDSGYVEVELDFYVDKFLEDLKEKGYKIVRSSP